MFELLGGGVLGSLLGGVFRLIPEVLKSFDKKNERTHELAMFDKQCDLEKTRGAQKLQEIGAERTPPWTQEPWRRSRAPSSSRPIW